LIPANNVLEEVQDFPRIVSRGKNGVRVKRILVFYSIVNNAPDVS
jgi:hypothetical protein